MKEEIIKCDICKNTGRSGYKIEVENYQGNAIHLYKYEDICKECSAKIAEFILTITNQKP